MPVTVAEVFQKNIEKLQAVCGKQGDGVLGTERRVWFVGDLDLWDGRVTDPTLIGGAFDRTTISDEYVAALEEEGGTVGELSATKMQCDYVASMERAFRLRFTNSVRAKFHAAARRKGHSAEKGVLARTMTFAQELIAAGTAEAPVEFPEEATAEEGVA